MILRGIGRPKLLALEITTIGRGYTRRLGQTTKKDPDDVRSLSRSGSEINDAAVESNTIEVAIMEAAAMPATKAEPDHQTADIGRDCPQS